MTAMGCNASISIKNNNKKNLGEYLTKKQIGIVKETWKCIDNDLQATGMIVFKRLFELERGLKKLFLRMSPDNSATDIKAASPDEVRLDEARLGRHVISVMQALGAAVASLDDSRYLTSVMQNLGEMHVNYKVTGEMLPKLWPAIDHALREKLEEKYTAEAQEAWRTVFFFFISKMREGMEAAKKSSS